MTETSAQFADLYQAMSTEALFADIQQATAQR
jgi:hypothetical protein